MRPQSRCAHPGCDREATEVAVVDSAWEDAAAGSALMVCTEHANSYVRRADDVDATVRARRRHPRPTAG